jgi:osmoprotectant transport system permease protein
VVNWTDLAAHTWAYLTLAFSALAAGTGAGVPLGAVTAHTPLLRAPILALGNIGRVVPSLAILTFMLPVLGVGFLPAFVALTLLAAAPVLINTDLAFRSVPAAVRDAARGMGMTGSQQLWRVEWPIAFPILFTGVRTAATEVIGSAVLASFIGAGGLGEYITTGLQANQPEQLWTGVIAIGIIALVTEFVLGIVQSRVGEAG